jgi:hypothetical protein
VKLPVRCGVLDGGKPCGRKLGTIERDTLPGLPLRWEERHYVCPKHGAMQIHEQDLLHRTLNPSRRVLMARSVLRMGDP